MDITNIRFLCPILFGEVEIDSDDIIIQKVNEYSSYSLTLDTITDTMLKISVDCPLCNQEHLLKIGSI